MDIFQEVISEEIDKKDLKEKNDDKLGDNQESQSGQAFESTASNK